MVILNNKLKYVISLPHHLDCSKFVLWSIQTYIKIVLYKINFEKLISSLKKNICILKDGGGGGGQCSLRVRNLCSLITKYCLNCM